MAVEQSRIDFNRNLIGFSTTRLLNRPRFDFAREDIEPFLSGVREVILIPYAMGDHMDAVVETMGVDLKSLGIKSVRSTHQFPGEEDMLIEEAEVVFMLGGNSGRLVANLYALENDDGSRVDKHPNASRKSLVEPLRERGAQGLKIIGSSAGLNVMCQDIRTTNDMQSAVRITAEGEHLLKIDGLGLLPPYLSINPHFQDRATYTEEERRAILAIKPDMDTIVNHQGESREDRLIQILEMDHERVILALREGAYIVVKGTKGEVKGETGGVIFEYGKGPQPVQSGYRLNYLLRR